MLALLSIEHFLRSGNIVFIQNLIEKVSNERAEDNKLSTQKTLRK
jgi:hypothetical protein